MARWALISGSKRSEASSRALELGTYLSQRGYRVGGFIQLRRFDEAGRKQIDLAHLRTGRRALVASESLPTLPDAGVSFCSFVFRPEAFEQAYGWLVEDSECSDVLFVGDLSKVEIAGGGNHRSALHALQQRPGLVTILCVRADQLFYVVEKYSLNDDAVAALELPAGEPEVRLFREELLRGLERSLDGANEDRREE